LPGLLWVSALCSERKFQYFEEEHPVQGDAQAPVRTGIGQPEGEGVCFSKPLELPASTQCRNPKEDQQLLNNCHENLKIKFIYSSCSMVC